MSDSLGQWQAARLDAAFESYPDPRTLQLRMERLSRAYPSALSMLLEGSDDDREGLLALLTLGDAPVEEAIRHPHLLPMLLDRRNLHEPFAENPPPLPNLTRWKRHLWLKLLLRERLGIAGFQETASGFARLADETSALAMNALPTAAPLILFAMGKWGGRELNASSDIDPVFFAPTDSRSEEVDRTVRSWAGLLSGGETGDAIYPVDLRLRPEGASGPLACNLGEAERYFFQRAAPWERIAYLRARHLLGPLPEWFGQMLDQFLFGSSDPRERVGEVARALRNVHTSARDRDLKRSPGGIRDVEFLVASYQLSEGHHNAELRHGTILELLERLDASGSLTTDQTATLREGYILLRNAEHALQAEEDRAQFILPDPGTALQKRLAWAVRLAPDELEKTLSRSMKGIEAIVEELLLADSPSMSVGTAFVDPQAEVMIGMAQAAPKLNREAQTILRRLTGPWGSPASLFDASQLEQADDPGVLLLRLESSVNAYGGARSWKQAYGGNQDLQRRITRILRFGKRLLDEATPRPYLWEQIGNVPESLSRPTKATTTTLSDWLGNRLFLYGDRFIDGSASVDELTAGWTATVDEVIQTLGDDFFTHNTPPIALFAMGKWGGGELAPDADLDLMFVCGNGDGSAVASAVQNATRWMQEASLTGRLLLDARLRPEGGSAPMVITLSRLEDYLTTRAQPWERMALVRARFITGDTEIGQQAMRILQTFSTTPPDPSQVKQIEIARRKAAELSRPRHGILRLKKGVGGMMDFEFAATLLGWKRGLPKGEWWHAPIAARLEELAADKDSLLIEAAEAYRELRRWDMVTLLASGHRRGDIRTEGEEAERFADAAGIEVDEISRRWKEISALGREVLELGLKQE
ncbi:hypothetical protein KQI63_11055 [bacterium]|nr:hypothetical protein [bacterium]